MHKFAKLIQALSYWPLYFILKLFWHYKIEGQENLRGLEDDGIIFASNHASIADAPICGLAMPRNNKFYPQKFFPIRFLAWEKYCKWNNPFSSPFNLLVTLYIKINGSIPIHKAGGDLFKALVNVIEALKQKQKIWIYPEGKITRDGTLQPGKRGVAFLHQQTKAPIVPVALLGTFKMFSLKNILKKRKITIKIGKPIKSLENLSLEQGVDLVMQRISALLAG